jgi:hypothetical protein
MSKDSFFRRELEQQINSLNACFNPQNRSFKPIFKGIIQANLFIFNDMAWSVPNPSSPIHPQSTQSTIQAQSNYVTIIYLSL